MPAHVTLAASLGLGVYAASAAPVHPSRPFRMALDGPVADPLRSWAFGVHRGHEVLLGFTHGRQTASYARVDPIGALFDLLSEDLDLHHCMVRVTPSLLVGLEAKASQAGTSAHALVPGALPYLLARAGDDWDVEGVVGPVRSNRGTLEIGDAFVWLTQGMRRDDPSWLAWAVEAGVRVADHLARQRASMPPLPWEPAIAAAIEGTARARSLRFDRACFTATGTAGDIETEVSLTTSPPPNAAYAIQLAARYAPLGVGLLVFPQRDTHGLSMFMQDIKVGDPAFDDAFIVQCRSKPLAPQLLQPELRQRLLSMVAQAPFVRLDDGQVTLRVPASVLDPGALSYAYDDVVAVGNLLVRAARGGAPQGAPYR